MLLFLYLFVFSLDIIFCGVTERQSLPATYVDAAKSAKLINLVQQLNDADDDKKKVVRNEEMPEDKNVYESMKLLQKNYDTNRRFRENNEQRRVQLISNPEVLDLYKIQPSRREEENNYVYNSLKECLPFSAAARKEALRGGGLISMHYLSNPEALNTYRRQINKELTSSLTHTDSDSSINVRHDAGDKRRKFKKKSDQSAISGISNDGTDVTMKLDETFDIVKPFFVEVFNKLKDKEKYESESASSLETYESNKKTKSSDNEFIDKKSIEKSVIDKLYKISKKRSNKESDDLTDTDSTFIKNLSENLNKETITKNSLKEKEIYDSIIKEKQDTQNLYDTIWSKKKLPASKKSFLEPLITHDDFDKAYHDIRDKKNMNDDSSETRHEKNNDWNKNYKRVHSDFSRSVKKKSRESFHEKKKDWRQYDIDMNDGNSNGIRKSKKDVWNIKDSNWNKNENNNYDWNKMRENRNDKTDWDKNVKTNNNKDWNRKEKDSNKQEDKFNENYDSWNKNNEKWTTMDESWNKMADDWNKNYDKWNKKDNWNKKDDGWGKNNKGSTSRNDKNDKINKPNNKIDHQWDMMGPKKKKPNTEWGNYDAFKTKLDKHISVEKTKKEKVKSKPKSKNSWDGYIARTIRNNYKSGDRKINRQSNFKFFGRTPIPIVGNKAVYDR